MDNNRRTAMEALLDIDANGAYSNLAIQSAVAARRPDNEAFVRTLVYGTLENRLYLDHRLAQLVRSGLGKVRPQALALLRLGAYQIEFLDSVPSYAAIDESVKIAKKVCRGLEGFVNGVLRAYARGEGSAMPDPETDLLHYLSVRYSYAPEIVSVWLDRFGRERTEALLEAGNGVPALTLWSNPLQCSPAALCQSLEQEALHVAPAALPTTVRAKLAERVLRAEGSGLLASEAFAQGWFYVQDTASMAAVAALDPAPGDTLIDVCAAPGGKSFFAATLMEGKGRIFSCDVHPHKEALLRSGAGRLGIDILEPVCRDGRETNPAWIGLADKVIVDVPCSGLGVVRRRPEIKLGTAGGRRQAGKKRSGQGDHGAAKPKSLTARWQALPPLQRQLLESAAPYVKPGGRLLYSTCTISEAENEQVAADFLREHPDFSVVTERQLLPDTDGCDGFYFCVMERRPE